MLPTLATLATPPYVLLVDDHAPSLGRLADVFECAGFRSIAVPSAAEAVRVCDRSRPRVVVTDLAMPNFDGLGLGLWLRTRCPSVPLILMTGSPLDAPTRMELEGIFTAVLAKPLDIGTLLDMVARLMPDSSCAGGR